MEQSLRRDLVWGVPAGAALGLAALLAGALWVIPALLLLVAAWWILGGDGRWVLVFLAAALLLPPLPLPGGDSGPHPAVVVAALGLAAGLVRLPAWRLRFHPVAVTLLFLLTTLLLSVPQALLYADPGAAGGSLARVGLFAVSVYLYFYLCAGPGAGLPALRLVRLLLWSGLASAAFACLDFYYQFPAPSRFAAQYVWLPQGVLRRAQGVFYEASTLATLCVFLLVLIASAAALRLGRPLGLGGWRLGVAAIVLLTALMFSFSRAAVISLLVALAALVWLERRRMRSLWRASLALAIVGAAGAGLVGVVFPEFLGLYGERLRSSGVFLTSAPNLILSRRLESWQFLLEWIRQHPWRTLLGVGYKTLPYSGVLGRPVVVDNMYLSLLVETGVLGLGALLALHAAVLARSYREATGGGNDLRRLCGVWMFSFWCGLAVQMASGDLLTYWRILPAFFAVLAIGSRDEDPVPGPVH